MEKSIPPTYNRKASSSNSTNIFDERYYSFNKRILCAVGLWPYQCLTSRAIRILVLLFFSFTIMVPQIRAMIYAWGRFDKFVEGFSPLIANLACDVKLFNCIYHVREFMLPVEHGLGGRKDLPHPTSGNSIIEIQSRLSKIRKLLDDTQKDWERVRHLPEVYILREYGEKGRRFTIMYCTMVYVIISGWIVTPLLPKIMDAAIPLNHSRARFDIFPTDYMIDPDEYFYPILIHCSVGTIICLMIIVAVDTLYMSLAQHVCAMFEILRYNLETILQEDRSNVVLKPNYHGDIYYHDIVSCIKKHKLLVQYIKSMESSCEWCLFIIVGFNMLGLSFTGYQTVAKDTATEDVLRFGMFTIAQVIHLFCNSLPGHWIMDSSSYFPDAVYSCKWYMMSLRSRKLLIILINASIEPCTITAGKLYVMSIENFCSVLRTSMSYLTVLNTVQ